MSSHALLLTRSRRGMNMDVQRLTYPALEVLVIILLDRYHLENPLKLLPCPCYASPLSAPYVPGALRVGVRR